jgi:hypothetical protein
MRGISTLLATMRLSAALLFAAVLLSSPAQAGLMFDLSVSGNWSGSGSIDFTTASGTSTAGVDAFSFHVATSVGSPQDYDLADIAGISWSIDSSDDLTLLLISDAITFGSGTSGITLTNEDGLHPEPCGSANSFGSMTCSSPFLEPGGVLTATFVPEPGTLALFASALLGIAVYLRRRTVA